MHPFESILKRVNVPCRDSGRCFTDTERIESIKEILAGSDYALMKDEGLSYVYAHMMHDEDKPSILLSCHIDSLYKKYHHGEYNVSEYLGTFDNTICNAALIYLMTEGMLPDNALIAFTGDEENECGGAKETIGYLESEHADIRKALELVIVLDITSEGYDACMFTLENFFMGTGRDEELHLRFPARERFIGYLREKVDGLENAGFIVDDADPDETWEYEKYGLNCFTFCVPARAHPDNAGRDAGYWMHNDAGMLIKKESVKGYIDALSALSKRIMDDLSGPGP